MDIEKILISLKQIIDDSNTLKLQERNSEIHSNLVQLWYKVLDLNKSKSTDLYLVFNSLDKILKQFRKTNIYLEEKYKDIFIKIFNIMHDIYEELNKNNKNLRRRI